MVKRFSERGNRRTADGRRIESRPRQVGERGCGAEIREPDVGGDDQSRLTPQGLVAMYPLVGALLAELQKAERRDRAFRLRRA